MIAKLVPIALVCISAAGQTPQEIFEVASIKPATPLGPMGMRVNRKGGPGTADPGMYTCENCPLSWVVSEAYDLQPFEFAVPDWLENVRFDFLARIPTGTTKEAFRLMLQNLLADRFKLAVHREKKAMSVYELTVGKNGPKFRESVPKEAAVEGGQPGKLDRDRDGFPILAGGTVMAVVPGHARLRSDGQTMAWFARMLSGQLHGPVVDATGLKTKYDFVVSWSFGENSSPAGGPLEPAVGEPYLPALISAVQSQLGLKLEEKKGQADVLVVDHMEKAPTKN